MPPHGQYKEYVCLLKESKITDEKKCVSEDPIPLTIKIGTSLFYTVASICITLVNKGILTTYRFPSFQFLAFCQMMTTVVVLYIAKRIGHINFPDLSKEVFNKIYPLQFLYIGNTISGLGSTQNLSLPMFTVLRRIAIIMTMAGEWWLLKTKHSYQVQASVYLMIIGAVIAGIKNLAFNLYGYIYVMINNFFSAGYNVIIKQKLNKYPEIGKYGLLYYCALFMSPISFFVVWQTGDFEKVLQYPDWLNAGFLIQYVLSCTMGFILMYSIMICTQYNSALTAAIIGCLKNVFITYLGMFVGGDYIYSLENFVGINISVIGSLWYAWIAFKPTKPAVETA